MKNLQLISLVLIAALINTGCGPRSGVKRYSVSGTVTFDGQPVPHGKIRIEPDKDRGGSGPVGFATITDGKFSTRKAGKGAVSGPMTVMIEGYPSKQPMVPLLFPVYQTTVEIGEEATEFHFEIPKSSQGNRRG